MTRKLTAMLLTGVFFVSAVFAQTTSRIKEVRDVTIHIDGFMKSKSGAV